MSILLEPHIEKRPLSTAGHRPQYSTFSVVGSEKRSRQTIVRTQSTSLAPPVFNNSIPTSSRMSYLGRLTTHPLNARSNQGLLHLYSRRELIAVIVFFLLRFHL